MTCTVVLIEPVVEACRAPSASSFLFKHKSLLNGASDVEDRDEQQEQEQHEVHRPASCMSDYSPYVWNPQSQRYDIRRSHAESHRQQHHSNNEDQQYNPVEPSSRIQEQSSLHPQYRGRPAPWNPWSYLDNENQRPYTPTQPAVEARIDLPDFPTQYDPYRASAPQVEPSFAAYDSRQPVASAHRGTGTLAPSSNHQHTYSYQDDSGYASIPTYSDWRTTTHSVAPLQELASGSHSLPAPVPHSSGGSVPAGLTPILGSISTYTSTYPTSSSTSKPASASYTGYQALAPFQNVPESEAYDLSYLKSTSPEDLSRPLTSTSAALSAPLAPNPSNPNTFLDWIAFQDIWQVFIRNHERILAEQAAKGELPGFVPRQMAVPAPTFASCEDLVAGFSGHSYRITVDKLKLLIRGINNIPGLPLAHVKASGLKQELINRIVDVLRSLKNTQSPAYFPVAKLIGEAQGIVYEPSAANSAAASGPPISSYVPGSSTSSAGTSYARQYGSAIYTDIVPTASTSPQPPVAYPSDYAVRPAQFGLTRSPGRIGGAASSSAYGNTGASNATGTYNAYNNRTYSHSPNPQYRQAGAPPGASSSSASSASHLQASHRAGGGHTGYGSSLLNQIPTSLPTPLPPKSAIAGQPAIPMNFKPSPFFRIISAVSTVTTLPRPGHQNERGTATAYIQLTEDQRQKLLSAREDPKAPQYQLRLYCTSGDFYHPHATQYGTAARQALPIEFPMSSEAKMNDVAVVANLRGIKKKPGTAPPAHVSSAKIGTPSRTTSSTNPASSNGPLGSYALKLANLRETNKVELVYMNTEKTYYMIVYFVETFSVSQVVEKIKKDRFRQKEDVLKSIHRAAEDPDIQATASTITMKDPLTFTTLNTPIRSINCVHLQCYDAFCFLSMMESTPDWKCPVCNRAIQSSDELVHDGFFQDIQDSLPAGSGIETVIIEVDGTWRTEDNQYGNAKKAIEYREKMKNGLTVNNLAQLDNHNNGSAMHDSRGASSSVVFGKDGTPMEMKPDIGGGASGAAGGLTVPSHGMSRGNSKSKTPAAIIELDDDDDDDQPPPYGNDDTPPPPSRAAAGFPATSTYHSRLTSTSTTAAGRGGGMNGGGGARTAGKVIDLTLSDSDDEDGASSSIVGMGSRAPSIRTPGRTNNGIGGTTTTFAASGLNKSYTPAPRTASSQNTVATIPSSAATVNGHNAANINGINGDSNNSATTAGGATTPSASSSNVVAGVKRRQDSEAAYEDLWGMEEGVDRDRSGDNNDRRPAQMPRYS